MKALYEKNLISQSDYDQAVYNYENSKAAVISSRSNLARSKVNLDYATITSPINGVVLNRAVEEGQTVAASFNTPELFTIVNDLTQMEVQTSVDEADIERQTGSACRVFGRCISRSEIYRECFRGKASARYNK
jgi:HlyD family secretion protein